MKKIICALMMCFCFMPAFANIDTREYVDWRDFPNVVQVDAYDVYNKKVGRCTGTQIDRYVITAAHCVENHAFIFKIHRNDGTSVDVNLISKGDASKQSTDWAILQLPTPVDSEYVISPDVTSNTGNLYGFGALKILSDDDILKIREYIFNNSGFDSDRVLELLDSDIPGVGYIYNDGDRLKKSTCSGITTNGDTLKYHCIASPGNSGGGLFVNNVELSGIVSQGPVMIGPGDLYAAKMQPVVDELQRLQSDNCNVDETISRLKKIYDNQTVERFGDYLYTDGNYIYAITDLCGHILLRNVDVGRIKNIEYRDGFYEITSKAVSGFGVSGAPEGFNNALTNAYLKNKNTDTFIYRISADDVNSEHIKLSIDGGKNFFDEKTELKKLYRSLFNQSEMDNMPTQWQQFLQE